MIHKGLWFTVALLWTCSFLLLATLWIFHTELHATTIVCEFVTRTVLMGKVQPDKVFGSPQKVPKQSNKIKIGKKIRKPVQHHWGSRIRSKKTIVSPTVSPNEWLFTEPDATKSTCRERLLNNSMKLVSSYMQHFSRMDSAFQDWILFGKGSWIQPDSTRMDTTVPFYHPQALQTMTSNDRDIDQFVQFQSVYHTIRYDRPIVFDTGATISLSPSERDFISWDDYSSASPNIQLQAVNGMVSVANVGTLQWTIYDDSRVAHTIVTKGFYVPESPIRLFSPQSYLQQPDVKGKGGRFVMSDNECYFMFPKLSSDGPGRKRLTFHMHHLHPLPVAFPDDRLDHPKYNWLHGRDTDYHKDRGYLSVVDETNTNIDLHQKELLRWHFRFGHFNMEWIKTLMRVPRGREGDKSIDSTRAFIALIIH